MMPDVTIKVPELEIDKKHIGHQYVYEDTSGPCTHKPSNSSLCFFKLSGASPIHGVASRDFAHVVLVVLVVLLYY
jgi:hypothetical protein